MDSPSFSKKPKTPETAKPPIPEFIIIDDDQSTDPELDQVMETLSSLGSGISEANLERDVVSSKGRKGPSSVDVRYLIHTSTIFLPTTVDMTYMGKTRAVERLTQKHCNCCMWGRDSEMRFEHCPCGQEFEKNPSIRSICFLEFLRKLSYRVSYPNEKIEDLGEGPEVEPEAVLFCKDGQSILSERYGSDLRFVSGVTGFSQIADTDSLFNLLATTYWFSSHLSDKKYVLIRKKIQKFETVFGFLKTRQSFKQLFHTLTGVIIKIAFSNALFFSSYRMIAEVTADLFAELCSDYFKVPESLSTGGYKIPEGKDSLVLELKDSFNWVKSRFNQIDHSARWQTWRFEFKSNFGKRWVESFFFFMESHFHALERQTGTDISKSLNWIWRCSLYTQTRILGHLPEYICQAKSWYYRTTVVNRHLLPTMSSEERVLKRALVEACVDNQVPKDIFSPTVKDFIDIKKIIMSETGLEFKRSASLHHTRKDGGKLQDLSDLFKSIPRDTKIRVYDLKITNACVIESEFEVTEDIPKTLFAFWVSFQTAINAMVERGAEQFRPWYYPIKGLRTREFFNARILHIQEPGKMRNLVKNSAEFNWLLSIVGSAFRSVLASIPAHTIGLKGTSHAWKFQQRLHPARSDARKFFDSEGVLKPSSIGFYSDWTESTDFLPRKTAVTMLTGFGLYTGFPPLLLKVSMSTLIVPQPVTEIVRQCFEDFHENIRVEEKSWITEGIMMGNQAAKAALHLAQMVREQMTIQFIDAVFEKTVKRTPVDDYFNLDRQQWHKASLLRNFVNEDFDE